ncbi:GcrA family cell cycle regulator [Aureimonas sp. N4]|uniref:GcrA family cell cycle regulator n=1 Tax=Aureimonas sp. N4 TaxID=1638165 RepID=UPI0007859A35|nr:GcrA family cell cycle regulator [Aureimonas sp. N4]
MSAIAPDLINTAAALWSEGFTATQIGERLGLTRNKVIGLASRNRQLFPGRTEGAAEKEQQELAQIESLWGTGKTQAEIAQSLGKSFSTVNKMIRSWPERFPKRSKKDLNSVKAAAKPKAVDVPSPPPRRKPDPSVFSPIEGTTPVLLWEAPNSACRWPVSTADAPEKAVCLHVCGVDAVHGRYCAHHAKLSFGPGTASEREADRLLLALGGA